MITETITEIAQALSKSAGLDIHPEDVMCAMAYNGAYVDDVTDVVYFDETGVIRVRRMAETGRMRTVAKTQLDRHGLTPLMGQAVAIAYGIAREGTRNRWVAYNPTAESVVDQLYIESMSDNCCIVSPDRISAVLNVYRGMPVCNITDMLYDVIASCMGTYYTLSHTPACEDLTDSVTLYRHASYKDAAEAAMQRASVMAAQCGERRTRAIARAGVDGEVYIVAIASVTPEGISTIHYTVPSHRGSTADYFRIVNK